MGLIVSESVVEPRTSTKRKDSSSSAPPGWVAQKSRQWWQNRGLRSYRPRPVARMARPPMPENGAWQFLHRSAAGMSFRTRRPRRNLGASPVRALLHRSVLSVTSGAPGSDPTSAERGRTSLTTYIMTSTLPSLILDRGALATALHASRCSLDSQRSKTLTRCRIQRIGGDRHIQAARRLPSSADEVLVGGHIPVAVCGVECRVASDDQHRHSFLLSLGGSRNCVRSRRLRIIGQSGSCVRRPDGSTGSARAACRTRAPRRSSRPGRA